MRKPRLVARLFLLFTIVLSLLNLTLNALALCPTREEGYDKIKGTGESRRHIKLRNFVVGSAIGLAVIFGAMSLRADEAITKTHGFNFLAN